MVKFRTFGLWFESQPACLKIDCCAFIAKAKMLNSCGLNSRFSHDYVHLMKFTGTCILFKCIMQMFILVFEKCM